ncbi:ferrous iron transport protein A [Streptomyces sp. NPDC007264]|uniref:FeoA family protein n=1 Tax=Streptomyces sp. NPDC007264 TaxID=3364777 RepID=UPI0036DBA50B
MGEGGRDPEGDAGPSVTADLTGRVRPLADLPPGARAVVVAVVDAVPGRTTATARRLGDLGFTPGSVVEVVRRAPLRDPVVYRVKDYEVCLRRTEAASVHTIEADR